MKLRELSQMVVRIDDTRIRRLLLKCLWARWRLDKRYDIVTRRENQLKRIELATRIALALEEAKPKEVIRDYIEDWQEILGPMVPTYGEDWTPKPSDPSDVRTSDFGVNYNLQRKRLKEFHQQPTESRFREIVNALETLIVTWIIIFKDDHYAITRERVEAKDLPQQQKQELLAGINDYRGNEETPFTAFPRRLRRKFTH